jgi:hypothetical protein
MTTLQQKCVFCNKKAFGNCCDTILLNIIKWNFIMNRIVTIFTLTLIASFHVNSSPLNVTKTYCHAENIHATTAGGCVYIGNFLSVTTEGYHRFAQKGLICPPELMPEAQNKVFDVPAKESCNMHKSALPFNPGVIDATQATIPTEKSRIKQ